VRIAGVPVVCVVDEAADAAPAVHTPNVNHRTYVSITACVRPSGCR
jgi:hypothetical protein